MKYPSPTTIASGLLLAAFTLQGAQAQTKPARLVTRDELRACMNSESDLAGRRKALEARGQQNREEAAAIRAEGAELAEEQKRFEDDATRMERFINRRVKPHNLRVKTAQAGAESLRVDLEGLNKSLMAHNEQCGGITFRAEDKEAILKERESPSK
jgi:hypothetical protein